MDGWMDEWMRLFDAYLPLIALYLQNSKLIKNDNTQETVQIRTIATTATNMLECKKGANFSNVCTYF